MQRSLTETRFNLPSSVESFSFQGRSIYIKRDDLIDSDLSGNKFRKLYTLLDLPTQNYQRIISYGGSQSNAMASIAALCRMRGWSFLYITKTLSQTLQQEVDGNLKAALQDGMELLEVSYERYRDVVASLYAPVSDSRINKNERDLVLAQGGADRGAKEGILLLADEIKIWKEKNTIEKLTVVTPSGTGTTSFFLAQNLPEIEVVTTAAVGSTSYLLEQMQALGEIPKNLRVLESSKKYHFAKPYKEFLRQYAQFLDQGIAIDLLYAPKMFITLSEYLEEIEGEILYVHSGGVKGNVSMLKRYEHKGWL